MLKFKTIPGLKCIVDCVDYEDKSGEQLYLVEFLKVSPSILPPFTLKLKISTIDILFIFSAAENFTP